MRHGHLWFGRRRRALNTSESNTQEAPPVEEDAGEVHDEDRRNARLYLTGLAA